MNDPSCDFRQQQNTYFCLLRNVHLLCSPISLVFSADGSYFSQVKRSESEDDRSAVPSIQFACKWRHIAIQLTAVPTRPLHSVIDQLSVSLPLRSDATVATGNLQSVATHLRNAVHTHRYTEAVRALQQTPTQFYRYKLSVTVQRTVMSCRLGSHAVLQLGSAQVKGYVIRRLTATS